MASLETWLTTAETIAQLGVSDRTLRRYSSNGRIKTNKVGNSVFYDLTSFIDKELEAAAEEDKLTASPFVGLIYDSRYEKLIRGIPSGVFRPCTAFMLPAVRIPQLDGSNMVEYPLVPIAVGSNLDKRAQGGGLITGNEWNVLTTLPHAQKMIDSGVLRVFYPQEDSVKFENSYRAYSQSDAMELIANTYSVYDLERYALGEDRKIILAAIDAQRNEIDAQLEFNKSNVINCNDPRRNFRGQ